VQGDYHKMFRGTYTALVTPFDDRGEVDYAALRRLIEAQASAGIDGIVPVGTTGESPSLNVEEHIKVIEETIDACAGKMKVIAGTGANSTSEAMELTRKAMEAGADATLQVTPYYNKPSQEGLYRHFSAVAELGLPVILYNVPGRTSREIAVETIARLSGNRNIVAVKEAGGSVDRVSAILASCDICVLSGDDALTLPMMSVGAQGVISVASNVAPEGVVRMVRMAMDGRWADALELHRKYYALFCDLFIDTNPVPVKTAMAMMGLINESLRLPLCSMSDPMKQKLAVTLRKLGLVE